MSHVETELKFRADDFDGPPPLPGDVPATKRPTILLTASYWDTPDRALQLWGVSLRHRTASDGSEDGWTLKLPVPDSRHPSRWEITAEDGATEPPRDLTDLLALIVRPEELLEVAVLTTRRKSWSLAAIGESPQATVTDDRVDVERADGTKVSFREFEAEAALADRVKILDDIDRLWRRRGLTPSSQSKIGRALGVSLSARPTVRPDSTRAEFVASLVDAGLRQLVTNALSLRADPAAKEAVHQARVATRRLRSDLKTFRAMLRRERTEPLRGELKWLGGLLGELRDAQVRGAQLRDVARCNGFSDAGLDELEQLATGHEDLARANLLSALGGDRARALVASLQLAIDEPPVGHRRERARPAAAAATRKRWKRIRSAVKDLGDAPDDASLHAVRKDIKTLRYGLQSAKSLGVRSPGLIKALGHVQDDLGDLHDTVVIRSWIHDHHRRLDRDAAFLAGQLEQALASDHRRLEDEWGLAWRGLRDRRIRVDH